jgi:tryptophan synthase beta subunit
MNTLVENYGEFGGMYVPELLISPLQEISKTFHSLKEDSAFNEEYKNLLIHYAGRITPLTPAKNLSKFCHGPTLLLKREDLLHTGAHKINNALGQCLLAKKMGKKRIIAETGAGQHGVATATACAYLGLACCVYMGEKDVERQALNVKKMRLLGAEVIAIDTGTQTLKDAVNAAFRDFSESHTDTFYCLGSALGPYPYPQMVAFFQSIIGRETKNQCLQLFGKKPDVVIACIGGGSNAIGIFSEFIDDSCVRLIGVEAGGQGIETEKHAARLQTGKPGVLHGCYSYLLQDDFGQTQETYSISAGLDYPMIGPQHASLYQNKRVEYHYATDQQVIHAFKMLSKLEGIIPALESAHAIAYYLENAHAFDKDAIVIVNLSGRGDKDLDQLIVRGEI